MVTIPHKTMNRGVDITPVCNTENHTSTEDQTRWTDMMLAQTLKREEEKWYTEEKKNKKTKNIGDNKGKGKIVTHGQKPEGCKLMLLFKSILIELKAH